MEASLAHQTKMKHAPQALLAPEILQGPEAPHTLQTAEIPRVCSNCTADIVYLVVLTSGNNPGKASPRP